MKPFSTIDGATLMSQPLRPPPFVVDGLMAQGLHLLAGAPKAGKSWLALWLAVTVAKGEEVWGLPTRQGTTLYLCLEDSMLRIQNRLFEITEDAPPNVHFCTEIITLWVTPRVKAAIQARAKQADMTVTDYLCLYGLGKKILQVDGLGQVLTELKAQGRNLKLVTGWNCTAQSVWTEIRPTKEQSRKMDGRQYYHFV